MNQPIIFNFLNNTILENGNTHMLTTPKIADIICRGTYASTEQIEISILSAGCSLRFADAVKYVFEACFDSRRYTIIS